MTESLKHWDLRTIFSAEQIACLAVGLDPAAPAGAHAPGKTNSEAPPHQADVLLRDIESAARKANAGAWLMMNQSTRDYFDAIPPNSLLSEETVWEIIEAELKIEKGQEVGNWQPSSPFSFSRARIAEWLEETGFQSSYDFSEKAKSRPPASQSLDEKPLTTVERRMLLTIIGVLASYAKLDVTATSKTAATIESAARLSGISLSVRGVEEHLKLIPEAMGTRRR